MSNPLRRITEEEWRAKAHAAHYHAGELAERMGVSRRTLERHVLEQREQCPHLWLHDLRMNEAHALVADSNSVKESAAMLGYKDASQFSKDFKAYHGILPSQLWKKLKAEMLKR